MVAWIGAAIGAASSIIGGALQAKSAQKQKRSIEQRKRENQDWYNRRYNEKATQRADAQVLLTLTEESIKNRNKAAAGTQAVIGGTDESVAATKEANSKALANAVSQINAQAVNQKQNVENKYLNAKGYLDDNILEMERSRAQQISDAVKGVGSYAANLYGKK